MIKILLTLTIINFTLSSSQYCNYPSKQKYLNLIDQHQDLQNELKFMSEQPLPIWYTDRDSNSLNNIDNLINNCGDSEPIVVIYGIPNKDCDAGESSGGSNKNSDDYTKFINNLSQKINNKKVTYIIEPDALSLSVTGNKCGLANNYIDNLKNALEILSQNQNAKLYMDVGFWVLIYGEQTVRDMLDIINKIDINKKLKGFSLNTSNYRKTDECINSCKRIRDLSGKDYKCLIDTSRNSNGNDEQNTWCNLKSAGIGEPPTLSTNLEFIDGFIWIKPAIETDGQCYGSPNSYQTSLPAGSSDIEWFKILWNNGIPKKNNLSYIPSITPANSTPAPTPANSTPAPTPANSTPVPTSTSMESSDTSREDIPLVLSSLPPITDTPNKNTPTSSSNSINSNAIPTIIKKICKFRYV